MPPYSCSRLKMCTVSASIFTSFDFHRVFFTRAVRPLPMPSAAPKRLGVAPSAVPSPRRATSVVPSVDIMLHGSARRSQAGKRARRLGSRFLRERPANHARYLHQLLFAAGCAIYGVQVLVLHRRREVCCRGWLSSNPAAHEEWAAALLSRFQRLG